MENKEYQTLYKKHKDVIENPAIKEVLKYKIYDPNQEEVNLDECIKNATSNIESKLNILLRKLQ